MSSDSSGAFYREPDLNDHPPAHPLEIEYEDVQDQTNRLIAEPVNNFDQLEAILDQKENDIKSVMVRDLSDLEGSHQDYERLNSLLQQFESEEVYRNQVDEFGGVLYGDKEAMRPYEEKL